MDTTNLHKDAIKLYNEIKAVIPEGSELAINMLVVTYSSYIDATEELVLTGRVIQEPDSNGNVRSKPSPWVKIQLDAQIQLLKLIQEFGLTPKSKSKIINETPETDPLTKVLQQLVEKR